MQNFSEMSDDQLRAIRGDLYQERENAQASVANYNENIMAVNHELASRQAAATEAKDAAAKTAAKPGDAKDK